MSNATVFEMMIDDVYMLVDAGWDSQDAVDVVAAYYEATEDEYIDLNAYGFCF